MDDKQCTLEIYKVVVDSTHKISQMRQENNKFFVSLLTAILGGVVAVASTGITPVRMVAVMVLAVVGSRLAMAWSKSIASYKNLNSSKFKAIHKLETKLPHQCFADEWNALTNMGHKDLTTWEDQVPQAAMSLFRIVGLLALLTFAIATCLVLFKSPTV